MEIQVNDFNITYNRKTDKYELYSIDISNKTHTYKTYPVNYLGLIPGSIIDDISDLTKLGYRFNPNLVKTIPEKKK